MTDAGATSLRPPGLDPRTKLGLLVCAGILALVLEHPGSLGALAALCGLPLLALPISWTWRLRAVGAVLAVLWSTALSQALFFADLPRVELFRVFGMPVWREGISYGLIQSLRFVAVTTAGIALAASTPLDRMLAALVRLRLPYALAFLAVTGLRFVPEVGSELLTVRRARARRGRPAHHRPPWQWLALEVSMLRPVVARSVRRARCLAESLDVRGFDAGSPRAVRQPLQMTAWEALLLGAAALATGSALVARLLYFAYLSEMAYFPGLRGLYGFVRAWL